MTRNHTQRGAFRWRCLLGHLWSEWSRPIVRHYVSGGLLGGEYIWQQRKCERCGAMHGQEEPQ